MRFTDTLTRWLQKIGANAEREMLYQTQGAVFDALSSVSLSSAGLVIKAGGGVLAKTGGSTWHGVAGGKYQSIASATDMPALTGLVITANKFNVACFFIDESGTTSVAFGTEATLAKDVIFPDQPLRKALIGFLLITHSATFTGNTTPLDTATTLYISPSGASQPRLRIE